MQSPTKSSQSFLNECVFPNKVFYIAIYITENQNIAVNTAIWCSQSTQRTSTGIKIAIQSRKLSPCEAVTMTDTQKYLTIS